MKDLYSFLTTRTLANVPSYAYLGNNEKSKPLRNERETRAIISNGLTIRQASQKKADKMNTFRLCEHPGIEISSFLESEEFLYQDDPTNFE